MAIGKFNSEQVAQILTAYSQETEQLFFLVDKEFKVCYFNKPFTDYFKLNASEIKDQYFGEALACKNSVKGKQACTLNVYCGICEIKKNLNLIFNKIKKRAEFDIVREFVISKETVARHIQFNIISLPIGNDQYALCILKDLRESDILKMLTQPED